MRVKIGAGWTAEGKGHQRKYKHESGWTVMHCGHPTALWPWAAIDSTGRLHTSGETCKLGYAFRSLNDAISHAESHMTGAVKGEGRWRA